MLYPDSPKLNVHLAPTQGKKLRTPCAGGESQGHHEVDSLSLERFQDNWHVAGLQYFYLVILGLRRLYVVSHVASHKVDCRLQTR